MSNKENTTGNKEMYLVTTDKDKRGVFAGMIDPKDVGKGEIMMERVRMVVYWDEETKGVLGLAANGPTKGCRITAAAEKGMIKGVTACFKISEDAAKKWEEQPWG